MTRTDIEFVARADGWFEIRTVSPSACLTRISLPPGFAFNDWIGAAEASGCVRERSTRPPTSTPAEARAAVYFLQCSAAELIETVDQILEYFESSGQPSDELKRLRARLTQWLGDDLNDLSDFDLAFADIELRELLADELRSLDDIWTSESLAVDSRLPIEKVVRRLRKRTKKSAASAGDPTNDEASDLLADQLRHPSPQSDNQREVG